MPVCKVCKVEKEDFPYVIDICSSKCFGKNFWNEYVEAANNGDLTKDGRKTVRVEGSHYIIGEEDSTGFRGFSGRKWIVEFIDGPHKGQVIETTNLWHQGDIPEDVSLEDNAIFVPQTFKSVLDDF